MVNFLAMLIERFSLSITVPELWGEMCTVQLFHKGSTSLHSNLPGQGRPPSTVLGVRKLETLGYPTVKTVAFPRFDTMPERDGRTDGRVCRDVYSVCKASFAARCKNQNTQRDTLL